jgi:MFS family permease
MSEAPRKGPLLIIFLTVFIDLLGFGIVLPLLPLYGKQFAGQFELTERQVGWVVGLLMASFSAMQFLFLPLWGRLSDRFGRRPILLIGLAGSTAFYFLFGAAAAMRSLTLLFVSRIGAGIAGATISTAQAYIADVTAKERRAAGMALIGAAFALGFTLGPLLGAAALLSGGPVAESPWPGYVAGALSGAALVLAIFMLPETRHHVESERRFELFSGEAWRVVAAVPSIGLLLLTAFIAVFAFSNFEATLSLQIDRIASLAGGDGASSKLLESIKSWARRSTPAGEQGADLVVVLVIFSYLGLILTLAQGFLVRRLAKRVSEAAMATSGAVAAVGAYFLLAWAAGLGSLSWFMGALAIEVVGFALVNPSLQSLISRRTPADHQGAVLGLGQSAASLARILGPVVGVRLFAEQPLWPYLAAGALMIAALAMIVFAVRRGEDYVEDAQRGAVKSRTY